jgi:hypothetical protein
MVGLALWTAIRSHARLSARADDNMMNRKLLLMLWPMLGAAWLVNAGGMQRIGHTTLLPRHSNPDDKGMYAAVIDPANGYAYFVGSYLFKLDITGNLPVQVGPSLNTGQFAQGAIDLAAGYFYVARSTMNRYALGAGTNPVASAGSLALAAGSAVEVVVDDSDPNPANHYGYVVCTVSGGPARVAKVALATMTELGYLTLGAGESNFVFAAAADAQKGYAYLAGFSAGAVAGLPYVVKIKLTPGTNLPVRIGAVNLDTVGASIDGGSIDTIHGYAYYGTYDSDTNVPSKVYKVKLEEGDAPPTLVGKISLHAGEGRLSASVCDPVGGYVYFANDNSYPGGLYQIALNGTNLPLEIAYLPLPGGPQTPPPNGVTTNNTTTNLDGILPFGEVFFRSAVFDSVRGYAYLGQDSRPNQIVKIRLAKDSLAIPNAVRLPGGAFQFSFPFTPGVTCSALAATNPAVPLADWSELGGVTEVSPGQFQFADTEAANLPQRFYRVKARP